jgi:hypothetical protein
VSRANYRRQCCARLTLSKEISSGVVEQKETR